MTREWAEKRAEKMSQDCCGDDDNAKLGYYAGYMAAYDDLKAEMTKVPWTIDEEILAKNTEYKLWSSSAEAFSQGIDWAEKRIKERG